MIPYTISRLYPSSSYTNIENIGTNYLVCSNMTELLSKIIDEIVEYMDEFCKGYSYDITSYDDFCKKWWDEQECNMNNYYIYEIHYFENNVWNELKITDYKNEIWQAYVKS
jgi:hypothetical protein